MRYAWVLVALLPIGSIGCEQLQTCSTCSDEAGDTAGSETSESTSTTTVGSDDGLPTTDDADTDLDTDESGSDSTDTSVDPCEAAQNEPMADTGMYFQVQNVGDTPVFMAATDDCTANDFRIREWSWTSDVDALWSSTFASQGNECVGMQPPCGFGCTNDDPEQYLRIEPGATAELFWDGYWWETITVDGSCLSPECAGPVMCNAGRQAGSGDEFGLEAVAYSECTPGDFTCDCEPGETSCVIYTYGGVGGASQTFTQDFPWESDTSVSIFFGN